MGCNFVNYIETEASSWELKGATDSVAWNREFILRILSFSVSDKREAYQVLLLIPIYKGKYILFSPMLSSALEPKITFNLLHPLFLILFVNIRLMNESWMY